MDMDLEDQKIQEIRAREYFIHKMKLLGGTVICIIITVVFGYGIYKMAT